VVDVAAATEVVVVVVEATKSLATAVGDLVTSSVHVDFLEAAITIQTPTVE